MAKEQKEQSSWIGEEIKTADLRDKRLNRRLGTILDMLSCKPTSSIPSASRNWCETKAAYRFFDNDGVTGDKILQPHCDATIERMRKETVVLLPQDTTELDYTSKRKTKGLGKLSYETQWGMYLHPTIAVTPERVCLGIVNTEMIIRKELRSNKSTELVPIIAYLLDNPSYSLLRMGLALAKRLKNPRQSGLPIEQKESLRWLNSYRLVQTLAEQLPETTLVSIADREGDIYEIFVEALHEKKESRAEFIIRGNQDRVLTEKETIKVHKKLKKKIAEAPVLSIIEFELPPAKNRKARHVTQEIQTVEVELKAPFRKGQKMPSTTIRAVFAREVNAPNGIEPIEWLLLTSLPINTAEQAIQVITWYLCRWQIEIFFKILKTGCEVEELQLQTLERIKPCLALYMIIAWRILYLTMLGRFCPDMPCSSVFEEEEWHAVYVVTHRVPPPKIPPDLNTMIRMIAGLGGFLNRKGDGFPGPQPIWIGLQRTRDFVIAMEALNASRD